MAHTARSPNNSHGLTASTARIALLATATIATSLLLGPVFAEESHGTTAGTTTTTIWTDLDRDGGWVYIKNSSYFVNAHQRDLRKAKSARRDDEPIFYIRLGSDAWLIRDPQLLDEVEIILEPQIRLGREQAKLGEMQGELGQKQGALGAAQGKLGAKQGELGRLQAEAAHAQAVNDKASARKLQKELSQKQRELGQQQGELGRQQGLLGKEQGKLGELQGQLGSKQGDLAKAATKQLEELTERAIRADRAKRLR